MAWRVRFDVPPITLSVRRGLKDFPFRAEDLAMNLWKTLFPTLAIAAGLVVGVQVVADEPTEKVEKTKLRVGTFDSRAVLFAYVGSEMFRNQLKTQFLKLRKSAQILKL